MIDINFSVLCTIEFLHEYYSEKPWFDFIIVPSQQTIQLLGNCRMIYRQQANQLIIGIQSEVTDSFVSPPVMAPFIIPPSSQSLTFFIQCNNPVFLNFTNIPLAGFYGKLFYFTNRNNNAVHIGPTSTYYLSASEKNYSNVNDYNSGDIVTSAGTVYTAIQSISHTGPVDPPNENYWRKIDGSNMYASQNDLVQWLPSIYNYPLGSIQTAATYQVNGYNDVSSPHDYSAVIVPQTMVTFPASDSFKLDLSSLPTGKYDLIVNDKHTIVYLNNELTGTATYCGVIELYNETTLPAGYSYLDNIGNLLAPSKMFSIYFLNRATIWKYILKATSKGTITMAGYNFPVSVNNPIFSISYIPLSEIQPTVKLNGTEINDQLQTITFTNKPVSCASANFLSKNIHDPMDTRYYSEIFLNY